MKADGEALTEAVSDLLTALTRLFDFQWTGDDVADIKHLARMVDHVHCQVLSEGAAERGATVGRD